MFRKNLVDSESETEEFETELNLKPATNSATTTTTSDNNSDSSDPTEEEEDDADESDADILAKDSDEDGPPTSLSFIQSRESAVQKIREAISLISSDQRQKKDRRKWLDEKYKKQKEDRLKALSAAELSEDILAAIPSQPKKKKAVTGNEQADNTESIDDLMGQSINTEEEEVQISEEFIPLNYDRYAGVTVLSNNDGRNSKSLSQSAAEFRQNALYGNRIRREPTRNKMAKAAKRKAQFP